MEACPFCGGEVSEQVVIYGGTCPHCFGHIPGEEAATDPGDDVREAQEASDRKRAQRRAMLPIFIAAPVVLAIAGAVLFYVLQPEPELAVLDLDEGEFYTPDLDGLVVAQAEEEPPSDADEDDGVASAEAVADTPSDAASGSADDRVAASSRAESKGSVPTLRRPKLSGGQASSDAELLSGLSAAEAEDITRDVKRGADLAPTRSGDLELKTGMSTSGSLGGSGVSLDMGSISQSAGPLSGQRAIAQMISGVLRRQLPRLRPCYESSLRADPSFGGSWVLTFTVETDGSVSAPRATASDTSNAMFEECLVRRVEGWRFQRIVKPQPVKKTVDFSR